MASSGKMINIGSVQDDFYRYKMPAIQTKIEGRGNGIKTVIVNMEEIADALERPVDYTIKYFGFELGAQSRFIAKHEKAVVNGAHEPSMLKPILDKFIQRFVLCGQCGNPETVMSVDGSGLVILSCKACGKDTTVDAREKLCTYICKFPPERLAEVREETGARSGRRGRKRRGGTSAEGGVDIEFEQQEEHPVDRIKAFVESPRTEDELYMELIATQDHFKLSQDEMICLIFEAFFFDSTKIFEVSQEKVGLLRKFVGSERSAKIVLRYMELLVDRSGSEVYLQAAPLIMKLFYDEDVLEEEDILSWAAKRSSRSSAQKLRAAVSQFVAWLAEAEEESGSSDEGEEDSDEEVYGGGGQVLPEDEDEEDFFD